MYPREKFCEKCGTELNITSVYDLFARYDVKTGKKYREYQILRRCPQRRFWGDGHTDRIDFEAPTSSSFWHVRHREYVD